MPISVGWDNPELTIMRYTLTEPWTWEDFYAITEEGRQMREARGVAPVNIIIDFSATHRVPSGAMTHFGNMFRRGTLSTNKVTRIIIVKPNSFLVALGQMLAKLYPASLNKVAFVDTLDAAYHLLDTVEITHP